MAIFSVANRTSVATITTAALEIIAGANNAYSLKELGITQNAATASVYAYGQPAAKGVTPANGSTVQAEDQGNTTAGNTTTGTTWATGPTAPTNLTFSVSGGNLNLSWPTNYLGWSLQAQTNSLGTGLSTNWVTIPGTESVTATNFPAVLTNGAVFYRMFYLAP